MSQDQEANCMPNPVEKPKTQLNDSLSLMEILCSESPIISGRSTPAYLSLRLAKANENRVAYEFSPQRGSPAQTARNIQRIPDLNSDSRLLK